MASDERDAKFDKALARHLRSSAASGETNDLSAGLASQGAACPDLQTLAAYHERSLLPEEMNSWKEHIIACTNCQTILAHLEATEDIPLLAGSSSPAKSRLARFFPGARWHWLAPAAAIAAGLLVWVAWHENQLAPLHNSTDTKIAAKEPAPLVSLPMDKKPASPPAGAAIPVSKPRALAEDSILINPRAETDALKQNALKQKHAAEFEDSVPLAKRDVAKEAGAGKDATSEKSAELSRERKLANAEDKSAASALTETVQTQAESSSLPVANAQEQNADLQSQYIINAPKAPGPSPPGQAEMKKMKPAASPAEPKQEAASRGAAAYSTSGSVQLVAGAGPGIVSVPGSSILWRAGNKGSLEVSRNGGTSWSRQSSGVLVDLLAGSAPSDKICWIVGRIGAIILTTDGGEHWRTVASPISEDLAGVRATDALHATIWNAGNAKAFVTADGGLTWQRVRNP